MTAPPSTQQSTRYMPSTYCSRWTKDLMGATAYASYNGY